MWVIGNFKQNPKSQAQAKALAEKVLAYDGDVTIALAPSYVHLSSLACVLKASNIRLCAQDVSALSFDVGAYTGDVSAGQLVDIGADMVIIGHSERRRYHNESHAILTQKLANAKKAGLTVVFCVGEEADENSAGKTLQVLDEQLSPLLDLADTEGVLVAYEPVWAIGSGVSATLDDIEPVHRHIKLKFPATPVLYGGSVNADNASSFANNALIDGVLVGGACLQADSFAQIIRAFS